MIARIEPAPLAGSIAAIPSKSMMHRCLIAAALANGVTRIENPASCDDIEATLDCLGALGARFVALNDGSIEVHPIMKSIEHGILKALAGGTLPCRNSASTLRFLLPVACALGADATFTGAEQLSARPLSDLTRELIAAGCDLDRSEGLPLTCSGRIRPGTFKLPGNVSSQYVTGLMMAAPLLGAPSRIEVAGALESRPYIDMTAHVLERFGVGVEVEQTATDGGLPLTRVRMEGAYRTPGSIEVEGDWSNAAMWLCAGALGRHPLSVRGVTSASAQGDRYITAALMLTGCRGQRSARAATIRPDRLRGIRLDMRNIPDLVPPLAAVLACAEGESVLEGCARLRHKESDRLETVARQLNALGAALTIEGSALRIQGRAQLDGGHVNACGDHRIAMMAAIAAIRCTSTVEIEGAEAVAKSYPGFFDDYRALGGNVELNEE